LPAGLDLAGVLLHLPVRYSAALKFEFVAQHISQFPHFLMPPALVVLPGGGITAAWLDLRRLEAAASFPCLLDLLIDFL
jgi:hypothetical protein